MSAKKIKAGFFSVGLVFLSVSLWAQGSQQQEKPKAPAGNIDQYQDVHKGLFMEQDKTKDAVRLTQEASKPLPAGASPGGKVPHNNFVDEHIFGRIERDGIPHAPLSSDEEFIRRVYLDAQGLLPTPEAAREFVASKDPEKRSKLIDSLIGTEEFAEQWAWFYGALFRLNDMSGENKDIFQHWNKEWLRVDRPYNDVVRDLISASGKNHTTIPSLGFLGRIVRNSTYKDRLPTDADNYGAASNRLDGVDEAAIEIGRIFLGINLECISCHDGAGHLEPINLYLSERTRKEFSEQAAFLGRTQLIVAWQIAAEAVIDDTAKGYDTGNDAPFYTKSESRFPRTGDMYEPAFILTGERPRPGVNQRLELSRMITSHPQFSRAAANLIWSRLMTVGFVEPYDAFDLDRQDPKSPPPKPWAVQPRNPELMEALAADFREHNYSMHRLMKMIMKSSAYQLSSRFPGEWKDAYTPYYARKFVRVMTGPEVIDTVAQATGRPYKFEFLGTEAQRVKQLTYAGDVGGRGKGDGRDVTAVLNSFFEGSRQTPPTTGNKATILQAILLMKSGLINNRVLAERGSRVQSLLESGKSNQEVIEALYLSALTRWPTSDEMKAALVEFPFEKDRKAAAEDLLWTLLNGIEFVLNH